MTLNDELIGAYLDDELPVEERAKVERALAGNNGAGVRLERLRGTDELLRTAMRDRPAERSSDALLREALTGERSDPIVRRVLSGAPSQPAPQIELWLRRAAAIAAVCLIGVLAGRLGAPQGYVTADMRLAPEVSRVLDDAPSGEFSRVGQWEIGVALSFRAADGSPCRQFRTQSGLSANDAIACHDGAAWRLVAHAAAQAQPGYRAAASGADPIAAAAESLGASVLSETEEQLLIASDWRLVR